MISHLTVLYDDTCGFCVRCADWLNQQRTHLKVWVLPASSSLVKRRFPGLERATDELTVIDSEGGVYRGTNAWIMCLWAMEEWRAWSVRMATPALRPMAREAFELLSTNRQRFSWILGLKQDDAVARALRNTVDPSSIKRCTGAGCGEAGRSKA